MDTALGFAIGFFIPFFLFCIGRLGGGDVKLFAVLGVALGYPLIIDLFLWTCVFGFLVAFIVVVFAGRLKELGMDVLETFLMIFQRVRPEAPVKGLSTPLAIAIFISVCWLVFFPEHSRLVVL